MRKTHMLANVAKLAKDTKDENLLRKTKMLAKDAKDVIVESPSYPQPVPKSLSP